MNWSRRLILWTWLAAPWATSACTEPSQITAMPTHTSTGTSTSPFGNAQGVFPAGTSPVTGTATVTSTSTSTALSTSTSTALSTGTATGSGTGSSTGSGSGTGTSTVAGAPLAFTDISTAVTNDCGGGSCHGQGSGRTVYPGNQAGFDGEKQAIVGRLNDGTMPPGGTISATDKQLLLQYCSQ